MEVPDYFAAHKHSGHHRNEILASERCGCFYCISIFEPNDIADWIEEGLDKQNITDDGQTALCPKCGIDSVIGSASGYPITGEFLELMKNYWF